MSAGTGMGIDLTMVTTGAGNAQLPLGFIHTQPANQDGEGEKTFIYIGTTDSLVQFDAIERTDSTYDNIQATTGGAPDDDVMIGTLFNDMTDATLGVPAATPRFGFAQRTGVGTALSAAFGAFGNTASTLAGLAGRLAIAGAAGAGQNGVATVLGASVPQVPPVVGAELLPVNLWCKG